MLTPQEMREKQHFEKAVFGGYSMQEVDDYFAAVTEDYSALYKENAVLKSQLKVVVDRLEAYRKQEDSMNKAMINAQQAADELVAETERKCARMLSDTEQLLRSRKKELQEELEEDSQHVREAKEAASEFIAELQLQVQRCQSQLDRIRATIGAEGSDAGRPRSARGFSAVSDNDAEASASPKAGQAAPALGQEIDQNIGRILEELAAARADGSTAGPDSEHA